MKINFNTAPSGIFLALAVSSGMLKRLLSAA